MTQFLQHIMTREGRKYPVESEKNCSAFISGTTILSTLGSDAMRLCAMSDVIGEETTSESELLFFTKLNVASML